MIPIAVLVGVLDSVQVVLGFGLTALKRTGPSLLTFVVGYGTLCLVADRLPVVSA